jgi:uncharacterized membrane protein HdeD (DUF308 family)
MNKWLVDLHLLLYYFVGVFTIIASLAILLYIVIWLGIKAARQVNVTFNFHPKKEGPWKMVNYSFALTFWAIITSSFIVGMVQDVILGLEVLGYSLAGIFVLEWAWYLLNLVRHCEGVGSWRTATTTTTTTTTGPGGGRELYRARWRVR